MTPTPEPRWIEIARGYIGVAEIPGLDEQPLIVQWIIEAASWLPRTEGTAWCGAWVSHCLVAAGLSKPRAGYRARAYLDYGYELPEARYGAIAVLERGGAGHVGFVVGIDQHGRPMILGGNQKDRVGIDPFDIERVLAWRWPPTDRWSAAHPLPLMHTEAPSSAGEA